MTSSPRLQAGEDVNGSARRPGSSKPWRAKTTPERAWLAGAPSVALVRACNDARRAYRNWFDSLSGKRNGRRVGHPRFRKRGRQSVPSPVTASQCAGR